ncbi:MAG: hypothetical protein QM599_03660 [Pseudoxanthomonas sp.]
MGGRCEFVGMLGEDMFGDYLPRSLREAGAGTRYVRRTADSDPACLAEASTFHVCSNSLPAVRWQ